jgi:hypothetical protein
MGNGRDAKDKGPGSCDRWNGNGDRWNGKGKVREGMQGARAKGLGIGGTGKRKDACQGQWTRGRWKVSGLQHRNIKL